jgi:hypothetical protein
MDKKFINETKEYIKQSDLSKEAKTQLLSLMDFINYPEVKEKILRILDTERKITQVELKYLKEMEKRFKNSDIFGYSKQSMSIPQNMGKPLTNTYQDRINDTGQSLNQSSTNPQQSQQTNNGNVSNPAVNVSQNTV